ncbi:uncharacterized protein LOC124356643 isoform X2 [Homalodisca vitripennis]|nr:uncharacterized protein LOC124356643 isoform X2 [Homalodisca vitripennis]
MLKFLTHKLRTHSLNEEHPHQKIEDDDHDSGTESDDEHGGSEEPENSMESEAGSVVVGAVGSPADPCVATPSSPYFLDSALPSDSDLNYDHHSSEEELEVINSTPHHSQEIVRSRSASTVPEKRKWSQVTPEVVCVTATARRTVAASVSLPRCELSSSSDEEVQGLLATMSAPVQFCTSPPRHAHRPGHRSLSPPPKLFHYVPSPAASPRKRHRNTIQRPCLDFEKMQQMKARAVTAWRHNGEHGGELSVFCW